LNEKSAKYYTPKIKCKRIMESYLNNSFVRKGFDPIQVHYDAAAIETF